MTISVIVATFGDPAWQLEARRAVESVRAQSARPLECLPVHGTSLHEARNHGAEIARGDWLIFLDADDQLDRLYVASMQQQLADYGDAPALFQPRTLGVHPDGTEDATANFIPWRTGHRDLAFGNHLVIGTMVQRAQFLDVGGFYDWPAWEDWCLWWRCQDAGAEILQVERAIYRVGVQPASRNHAMAPRDAGRLAGAIKARHKQWEAQR